MLNLEQQAVLWQGIHLVPENCHESLAAEYSRVVSAWETED